jgi:hypothetical protein
MQEHSSSQRKQHFKVIQVHDGVQIPKQHILDMKIRWGSMYAMLNRAEKLNILSISLPSFSLSFYSSILLSMSMFSFMNLELN